MKNRIALVSTLDVMECFYCKHKFILFAVADKVPMSLARGEAVEQSEFSYCPFCGASARRVARRSVAAGYVGDVNDAIRRLISQYCNKRG